jgi:hypothetical protein
MTIPYTYLLTHISTGRKYYGVRYANNCHPGDLFVKYFSSSSLIKQLIMEEGKTAFEFEVRKTFTSKEAACLWEAKVLTRMNVLHREDWFNANIAGCFKGPASQRTKQRMSFSKKQYYDRGGKAPNQGRKLSEKWKQNISASTKGKPKSNGQKLSKTATGRKKHLRDDGSWTWIYPSKGV